MAYSSAPGPSIAALSASTMADASSSPSSSSSSSLLANLRGAFATPRARKQASLFFAGATFVFLSGMITRRALHKRHLAAIPRRFTPSIDAPQNFNGPLEAVEALSVASINVASVALMLTGGALWAFDVSTMDDLRARVRGGLGVGEQEAEEEMEEWMASVLERKEKKEEKRRKTGGGQADD